MKWIALLLSLLLLTGCASAPSEPTESTTIPTTLPTTVPTEPPTTVPPDPMDILINSMTTDEKVGQLFLARCDPSVALAHIQQYHLGGYVLFGRDFQDQTPDSFREKIRSYQASADIPLLLAVDEEGGTVARISSNRAFSEDTLPSSRDAFAWKGLEGCYIVEEAKCQLLQSLELNVNLGPVCDMADSRSAFMYKRSLGQDAATTSQYVSGTVTLMDAYGIGSCLKHFPGYGNNSDTHTGIAVDTRSLQQLEERDLLPFAAGIESGCGAIMVSHTIVQALDPELPASLSPAVHQYLRHTMGFDGVILTDDLVMQAITDSYGAGEAAVLAVLAENDLLCATDYITQYEAVLAAVEEGRIDTQILDAAVRRVLTWKQSLGLI